MWPYETPVSLRRSLIQKCLCSRATATVSKYLREIKLFFKFQKNENRSLDIPANLIDVTLYLSYLLDKGNVSSVSMAYSALKWVHCLLPTNSNPLDASICSNLVEAEKRRRPSPIKKKEPASPQLLIDLVNRYACSNATLKDLRLATMCTLSYVCLLRSEELLCIKGSDITVFPDHINIKIPRSKTDIYRQGQETVIHKSDKTTCPYHLLLRYLNLANINLSSSVDYIFRNVVYKKKSKRYILGKRKISYTSYREWFKQALKSLGYDPKLYGLHSFRSGGATTIARNLKDCPSLERLLKIHGRWRSDTVKDMYIKEHLEQRISIAKSTGL